MEIKQYFRILLKRLWIVMLMPLAAAAASAYASFYLIAPVYESNTTLYVISRQSDANPVLAYNDLLAGQQLVKDYREIIKSRTITSAVIESLKLEDMSPEELADKISVNSKNDTRIIEIRVQDGNAERAKEIADKTAEVFKEKVLELMKVENVNIVDRAHTAKEPVKPRPIINVALSLAAGFLAAVGIVFLLEYLDDTIKSAEDIEKYLGLNVLGTIPVFNLK